MTKARSLVFAVALGAGALSVAVAQTPASPVHDPRIPQIIDALGRAKMIRETALSPDGKFIVSSVAGRGDSGGIQLAPLDNPSAAKRLTACQAGAKGQESNAVFSPDSHQIAFFSDCTADQKNAIFLAAADGSSPHQLAALNGYAKELQWSPDGKQLGFLYVEGATRPPSPIAAEKPPSGVIGVEGLEIQRAASVNASTGQLTQITPKDLYVYEFDWSPDSTKVAYIAAPAPGENNWWVAKLYTQALGGQPTAILDPPTVSGSLHGLQIAVPRWSQDGRQIAFIGGLMSDQGSTGGDIYVIPSTGGEPKNVTPDRASTPSWFVWLDDHSLGISEIKGGSSHLFVYDINIHQESSDFNLTLPGAVTAGGLMMSVATSQHQLDRAHPLLLRHAARSLGR